MNMDLNQNNDPQMDGAMSPPSPPHASYPEITIHHHRAHKVPRSGVAKVKYHVTEKKAELRHGKTHHSARIALHSFSPIGGIPNQSDEEALESAMQEQAEQAGGGDDTRGN